MEFLIHGRNILFRLKCKYYRERNKVFDERIHDYGIQWVNPDSIRYITYYTDQLDAGHAYLQAGAFSKFKRTGAVQSGNWDNLEIEFTELHVYQVLKEHIKRGKPLSETEFVKKTEQAINRGESRWRCESKEELKNRCEYIESLYRQIKCDGYRSQRSLGKYPVDEINVNVGRDGRLLFNDGRHRLAIAKLLDLNEIPVRILVVHDRFHDENKQLHAVSDGEE